MVTYCTEEEPDKDAQAHPLIHTQYRLYSSSSSNGLRRDKVYIWQTLTCPNCGLRVKYQFTGMEDGPK